MNDDSTIIVDRGPFEMCPHWLLFDSRVSALAVRLYLVLRMHADVRGECFPSRQRLANLLHVSIPTVDKARQQLLDAGAISVTQRQAVNGEWKSLLYRVFWERSGGRQDSLQPGKESYTLTNTHLTHTKKQSINILTNDSTVTDRQAVEPSRTAIEAASHTDGVTRRDTRPKARRVAYSADFEEWWRTYPRKVAKRAAWEAYQEALTHTDTESLLDAAKRYSLDPNREQQFTPHPTTWLRQGRWDDDPLPKKSNQQQTGGQRRMNNYADIHASINRTKGVTAQ